MHSPPGDFFPPQVLGSVYAVGGTGSNLVTVVSIWVVSRALDLPGSYLPVFVGIGALMPVACLTGFLLIGRVERLKLDAAPVIPVRSQAAAPGQAPRPRAR